MNEVRPASQSTDRGEPDIISEDLPCANCAYNLRTLSTAGRCPECGAAVAETLALTHFDAAWLADLDRGAATVQAGFIVVAAVALLEVMLLVFGSGRGAGALAVLAVCATLFWWSGGAYEMAKHPPGRPADSFVRTQTLIWMCATFLLIEFALLPVLGVLGNTIWWFLALLAATFLTAFAIPLLLGLRVASLAKILRRPELTAPSRWVVGMSALSGAFALGSMAVNAAANRLVGPATARSAAYTITWCTGVLVVLLGFAVLVMLHRFRRALTYLRGLHSAAPGHLE